MANTVKITATRNGKPVALVVETTRCEGTDLCWVRKEGGKPLFGATGYWRDGSPVISSYRRQPILSDVRVVA